MSVSTMLRKPPANSGDAEEQWRADRNLWLTARRAMVMLTRAIEFRYGIDTTMPDCSRPHADE